MSVSEQATPDQSTVPSDQAPDQSTPDQSVPPTDQGPNQSLPDQSTVPSDQAPNQSLPNQSVPDQSVPDQSVPPADQGPNQSLPDQSTGGTTTTGTTTTGTTGTAGAGQDVTYVEYTATSYHNAQTVAGNVPVLNANGEELGSVTGRSFVDAAMEGSALLPDNTQIGVDRFITPPDPSAYADAVAAAKKSYAGNNKQGRPLTPKNVGLSISGRSANKDIVPRRDTVSQVLAFRATRAPEGVGRDLTPYRSVAVSRQIALGTQLYIQELAGRRLPDGSTHDGWVTADDHGGNITGNRLDFYCGQNPKEFLGGVVHVYIPPAGG